MIKFLGALLLSILAMHPDILAAQARSVYSRCSACHLANGTGVPGAFPPLRTDVRALARSDAGRKYLILVVLKGVSGTIIVDGKTYRGIMPGQAGLDDAAVSAVLNYVANDLSKGGADPRTFSTSEIAAVRRTSGNVTPAQVAKLRPKL